jgi:hypothetical protein
MHVVADVDDFFFVLSFSQSRLVVFCSRFIIMLCLTVIVFVAFPESLYCIVLYCTVLYCAVFGVNRIVCLVFLVVGELPCEPLYCTVLTLRSQQIVTKIFYISYNMHKNKNTSYTLYIYVYIYI